MNSDTILIPAADQLAARIRQAQNELRALRRLYRLARAAEAVEQTHPSSNIEKSKQTT